MQKPLPLHEFRKYPDFISHASLPTTLIFKVTWPRPLLTTSIWAGRHGPHNSLLKNSFWSVLFSYLDSIASSASLHLMTSFHRTPGSGTGKIPKTFHGANCPDVAIPKKGVIRVTTPLSYFKYNLIVTFRKMSGISEFDNHER